ncbi:MAG: hypothetical protein R6W73_01435 [Candidatus Saliniplasma sp.]
MLTLVLADCMMRTGPQEMESENSRPDLVHFSLLLAHNCRLAEEREIRTILHTRENKVFRFEADANIPDRLKDFKKLIIRIVQERDIKGISFNEQTLMDALKDEVGEKVVMSPKGTKKDPSNVFSRAKDYVVTIGGFPSGDFVSPVYKWSDEVISISDRMMKPWSVVAETLSGYRYSSLE